MLADLGELSEQGQAQALARLARVRSGDVRIRHRCPSCRGTSLERVEERRCLCTSCGRTSSVTAVREGRIDEIKAFVLNGLA